MDHSHERHDGPDRDELDRVGERLRAERAEATPLELDRIKLRAMSQTERAPRTRPRIAMPRVAAFAAVAALLAGGGGVLIASGDKSPGTTDISAAASQYCPPPASGPPKPKSGANKCGQPKTK